MSSALKPVLTPSGPQNPPVSSQINKPPHPQSPPTTYGQSVGHIPQNVVNIQQTSSSIHNPAHSNALHSTSVHSTSHSANHYSLTVPNATQHYSIGGSTSVTSHSTPVSNHPVPNTTQSHMQPCPTFSTSPKNLSYNPNYQSNLGHSYKLSNVVPTVQTTPAPQPQIIPAVLEESLSEKPQSNGTPEIKIPSKVEPPQNHILTPVVKDKPPAPPPPPPLPPQSPVSVSPETVKTITEQPADTTTITIEDNDDVDMKESSEVLPEKPPIEIVSQTETSVTDSVSTSSMPTTTTSPENSISSTPITSSSPVETTQPIASTNIPEIQESTENSVVNLTNNPKPKEQAIQKTTLKLATTPRTPVRKTKSPKSEVSETSKSNKSEVKSGTQKSSGSGGKSKRNRIRTQPYQSPLPEVEMISKISATTPRAKNNEEKLIIFYKNEFLAVRNSEGGFYICQAVQNIYKSSPRIRIRWLSQDKNDKEIYTPDFYDYTDFDCILTNLNLSRVGKGKYKLPAAERIRTDSILKRALAVEKGDVAPTSLTEEHPDGLDLSLYKEESQLKKRKAVKRKASTPLKAASMPNIIRKLPDQPKIRKIITKPKPLPPKKTTVIKKALSTKVKKNTPGRAERAAKRQQGISKLVIKTSPIIDQKKAKVLAKVARKVAVVPPPKIQPPPKRNTKSAKVSAPSSKKPVIVKKPVITVTRKSKRGKK